MTDTGESLLAAYDDWRARRNELELEPWFRGPELVDSDDEAIELMARMANWLRASYGEPQDAP